MQKNRPLVSVILTSYNKRDMLKQAVCSVIAQTYQNWECIVVDDLSSDDSRDIACDFRYGHFGEQRVHSISTDLPEHETPEKLNRYAHNINLAVREYARGELITYLCDDDLYAPMRLEMMVSYLEQNPEAKIVYGKQLAYGYGKVIVRGVQPVLWSAAMKVDHSSVMHYRECFDKVGGWDESAETIRHGDAFFWRKLNEHWPFFGIDEVLDIHRFNQASVNAEQDKVAIGA